MVKYLDSLFCADISAYLVNMKVASMLGYICANILEEFDRLVKKEGR